MRRHLNCLFVCLLLLSTLLKFQISSAQNVGIGTNNPHASAKFEVASTNSGFLPPRLTYFQRDAISNPAQGLIIYCSDCLPKGEVQVFNGTEWTNMMGGMAAGNYVPLPYIKIGNQIWSSKNLDVATYRNGDTIPQVTDSVQWANLTNGAWCWYNNDSANYAATYGRLYNWYAVNDSRGLAPQGWHVPSVAEWNKLIKNVDPTADTSCISCVQSAVAGGALKSTFLWSSPNTGATNSSGFSGLPSGRRNGIDFYLGAFGGIGLTSSWWSADDYGPGNGIFKTLAHNRSDVYILFNQKTYGFSVRVVRD